MSLRYTSGKYDVNLLNTEYIHHLTEAIKTYNIHNIQHYSDLLLDASDDKRIIFRVYVDILINNFKYTDDFVSSVEFLDNECKLTLRMHEEHILNSYKYTDNIEFLKYFMTKHGYCQGPLFGTLRTIDKNIITTQLLRNISDILDILDHVSDVFIQMTVTEMLSSINNKHVLENKENSIVYSEIIKKLVNFKPLYKNIENLLDILYNIIEFDNREELFTEILDNVIPYTEYKRQIPYVYTNLYMYINVDDRYTLYREPLVDYLVNNKVVVSIEHIIETMTYNVDVRRIYSKNIIKHLYNLLETIDKQYYIQYHIKENKKKDVEKVYKYLFKSIIDIKEMDYYKIDVFLLKSMPLDKIQEYGYKTRYVWFKYKDIMHIFYVNHSSLQERLMNSEDKDIFKLFYMKLQQVVKHDYSSYKIEDNAVLKLFNNYSISGIIQEYI